MTVYTLYLIVSNKNNKKNQKILFHVVKVFRMPGARGDLELEGLRFLFLFYNSLSFSWREVGEPGGCF